MQIRSGTFRLAALFIACLFVEAGVTHAETTHLFPGDRIGDVLRNVGDGDVICVHSGVYYEELLILPDVQLTIRGVNDELEDQPFPPEIISIQPDSVIMSGTSLENEILLQDLTFTYEGIDDQGLNGLRLRNCNSITVERCNFVNLGEAGIYSDNSLLSLDGCTFVNNNYSADVPGFNIINGSAGGLIAVDCRSISISDCEFDSNAPSNLIVLDKSTTVFYAGAVYLFSTGDVETETDIVNCKFRNNTGHAGGAVAIGMDCTVSMTNCEFIDNLAEAYGAGAIWNRGVLTVSQSSFLNNHDGGGIDVDGIYDVGRLILTNSILWGPANSNQLTPITGGSVNIRNNDILSFVDGGATDGFGNFNADPLFLAPDDLRLDPVSPCINIGNNSLIPSDHLDLDGDGNTDETTPLDLGRHTRIVMTNVDLGAYEYGLCPADMNGDRQVDKDDLLILLAAWGTDLTPQDINRDGDVDITDLLILLAAWGPCP